MGHWPTTHWPIFYSASNTLMEVDPLLFYQAQFCVQNEKISSFTFFLYYSIWWGTLSQFYFMSCAAYFHFCCFQLSARNNNFKCFHSGFNPLSKLELQDLWSLHSKRVSSVRLNADIRKTSLAFKLKCVDLLMFSLNLLKRDCKKELSFKTVIADFKRLHKHVRKILYNDWYPFATFYNFSDTFTLLQNFLICLTNSLRLHFFHWMLYALIIRSVRPNINLINFKLANSPWTITSFRICTNYASHVLIPGINVPNPYKV